MDVSENRQAPTKVIVSGRHRAGRAMEIRGRAVVTDTEAGRVYRIPMSSERVRTLQYDSMGNPFWEVLGHTPEECNVDRFVAGASLREGHWPHSSGGGMYLGRAWEPELKDGELWANVQFMRSGRAAELDQGVADGLIQNGSIGFDVNYYTAAGFAEDGIPILRANWNAVHFAVTPDGEDFSIGFGRDADGTAGERTVPVVNPGETPTEGRAMIHRNQSGAAGGTTAPGGSSAEPGAGSAVAPVATSPQLNEQEIRGRAIAEDRQRSQDIEDMAEASGIDRGVYREWIVNGLSTSDAARQIRERRRPAAGATAQPSSEQLAAGGGPNIITPRASVYSVARAMRIVMGLEKRDGFEAEIGQEVDNRAGVACKRHEGGLFIPLRLSELRPDLVRGRSIEEIRGRAMGSTVAGGGAETVFDRPGDLIERLVPRSVVLNAGATMSSGLTQPVTWPKETDDVDAYWTSENPPSPVPESEMHFGTVTLNPRTLMATMFWPRQLAILSSIDIENRAQNRLANKIARMLDKGGLHGDGTAGTVLGVFNTPGVAVSDDLAGAGTFKKYVAMTGKVASVEGDQLGSQSWITTPEMAATLITTPKESGFPVYLWDGSVREGSLAGYPARASNQVAKDLGSGDDEHGIAYGDWSQLEFGLFSGVEVTLDQITLARYGQHRITLFLMADCVVKYPEAFCIGDGAKPD